MSIFLVESQKPQFCFKTPKLLAHKMQMCMNYWQGLLDLCLDVKFDSFLNGALMYAMHLVQTDIFISPGSSFLARFP